MTQPPGTGSLSDQLNELRRQFAELTRKSPANPACRVKLTASQGLAAGDTFAGTGWSTQEDPLGWFTSATPCYITIPFDGYYLVNYHSCTTGLASGQTAASKVTRNAALVTSAIATDVAPSNGVSEGCVQDAFRARIGLSAGDKLYWQNYASAATGTLQASSFSVLTEITVQFVSSR
jgi:hypothetical protein